MEMTQLHQQNQEMAKNEACLLNELQELRVDRDRKVSNYQQQVQVDKENFRNRLAEAEKKAKDSDVARAQMIFDFEKEKARW